MITEAGLKFSIIFKVTWKRVLYLVVYCIAVVFAYDAFGDKLEFTDTPLSIFGTVLAILLGFRVNNAYERWWDARKLWGKIVNDSRSTARMIVAFLQDADHDLVRRMVYRQAGYCYALRDSLRGNPVEPGIAPFFTDEEKALHLSRVNVPNSIMTSQSLEVDQLVRSGILTPMQQRMFEERFSLLLDSQGGCERIKKTVFPHDYRFYTSFFVNIFTYVFPLVLVDTMEWEILPWTVFVGFALSSVDHLAKAIEKPFENRVNDTAMTAISRTIEIDLRQMLGETEKLEPTKPVDGVLM